MSNIRWVIGVDISTQAITAMLLGVMEENNAPLQLLISSELVASRTCSEKTARRDPSVWVELLCECIKELKMRSADVERVEAVGASTTFPGTFPILSNGNIVPDLVRLYDDADDAGILSGTYEELLGKVENATLNRVWPGCMLIGISSLVKCEKLDLSSLSAIVPPNTALAYQLLRMSSFDVSIRTLFSDFSQTAISCVYDARSFEPLPDECLELFNFIDSEIEWRKLKWLLPATRPSWRNIVPGEAMESVRKLSGLPNLKSISIGAGDSALGNLALSFNKTRIINVRGSSDTPIIIVNKLNKKECRRETLLHYPLPSMHTLNYSNWCAAAPMLRSGRVWDWVKALRYSPDDAHADCELEELAIKSAKAKAEGARKFTGSQASYF